MPVIRVRWLVLIAGAHLGLLACWRFTAPRAALPVQQRDGELIFLTQALPAQARPPAPPKPPKPEPRRAAVVAQPAHRDAASAPAAAVQPPGQAAPDPFAQAAPLVVESVLERSRRAAIGVDRELRKESKNDNDRVLVRESKFAQDLALAYKGSGAFSLAETVLPNGDSLARVTTPLGSYCILKRGNRDKAGLNAIDNAGKTYIVTCPK